MGLQHHLKDHNRLHTLWAGLWEESFAINWVRVQHIEDGSSAGPRSQPCPTRKVIVAEWAGWTLNAGPSPLRGSPTSEKDMAWLAPQRKAISARRLGTSIWFKIQGFQGKVEDKMARTIYSKNMQWQWFSPYLNHWWRSHPHACQWVENLHEAPLQARVHWRFE